MDRRDFLRNIGAGAGAWMALDESLLKAQSPESLTSPQGSGSRVVMDLSGPWRLRMDAGNSGISRRWFEKEPSDSEAKVIPVDVPSVWQQYLDIQGGIGWYFKDVKLPQELAGKSLRVRFGAVDYFARVWWNGQEVGSHEGAFTPFELDVTQVARRGENRIGVRVSDPGRSFKPAYTGLPGWEDASLARVDGFHFDEIPAGFQDWREGFNHGGIWQPVQLIISHPVHVADAFILPRVSASSVEARLEIRNGLDRTVEAQVKVEVRPWKGSESASGAGEKAIRLTPGLNHLTIPVEVRQARAWSVEDPFLYVAEVSLHEGRDRRDEVRARFGFREFTVGDGGFFYLNGKRTVLKGAHYQSTEPLTLAFPHSGEMARKIVETAKEGGFNFMRLQGRPTAPSILDAADELGILLQSEPAMPRFKDNPRLETLAVRETTELIRRDRNRPAIVIWNMVNEQAAGMKVVPKMCQVARDLDPTRVLTESAGGNSHYYPPYSTDGISYLTEHYYPGAPLSEAMLRYMRTRGVPGQLYFVTEFGYGGLEDIDAVLEKYGSKPNQAMEDYRGFLRQKKEIEEFFQTTEAKEIFPDMTSFREAAQTLQANAVRLTLEALRSNPSFGGYNIVQLFDSNGNEVDGLVDFWRNKKKKAFSVVQEVNKPLLLIVQSTPFNPKAGQKLEVVVTLVNEAQISGLKTLRIRLVGPSGRELFSLEESVKVSPWVNRLFARGIPVGEESGRVTVEAEVREGSHVLLRKREYVTVYHPKDFRWPPQGFAVFDPQQKWSGRRNRTDLKIREFDPESGRPEVVVVPEFVALWRQATEFQKFLRLVDYARRGSTILFMGAPRNGSPPEGHREINPSLDFSSLSNDSILGFRFDVSEERGGWGKKVGPYGWAAGNSGAGGSVPRHPVFDGVPGPGLMDWEYGNLLVDRVVAPQRLAVEGTGPAIQIIPFESGKVVFCTLRLLEYLEQDGLAEKLLSNLVGYLSHALPPELRSPTTKEQEFLRFQQTQIRDCFEKYL